MSLASSLDVRSADTDLSIENVNKSGESSDASGSLFHCPIVLSALFPLCPIFPIAPLSYLPCCPLSYLPCFPPVLSAILPSLSYPPRCPSVPSVTHSSRPCVSSSSLVQTAQRGASRSSRPSPPHREPTPAPSCPS